MKKYRPYLVWAAPKMGYKEAYVTCVSVINATSKKAAISEFERVIIPHKSHEKTVAVLVVNAEIHRL
jgi:hypothetical protein